jgi:hypothetical protein
VTGAAQPHVESAQSTSGAALSHIETPQSVAKSHLENVKQSVQAAVEYVLSGNANIKGKVQSSMVVEGPDILAEDHRVEG